PREATYLESDEEIRAALRQRASRVAKTGAVPASAPPPPSGAARLDAETRPERPQDRPPLALICIVDDGQSEGEWVRLRGDRYPIGRTEGVICIPHDGLMSGRHAELVRQKTPQGYRWLLLDQKSTNGTFVRVGSSVLANQAEFIIGRGRFRFESGVVEQPAE